MHFKSISLQDWKYFCILDQCLFFFNSEITLNFIKNEQKVDFAQYLFISTIHFIIYYPYHKHFMILMTHMYCQLKGFIRLDFFITA